MQYTRILTAALLLTTIAACTDRGTSPLEPDQASLAPEVPALQPGISALAVADQLLTCPVSTTRSTSRTVGILGGTIALDGHRITFPPAAVLVPTKFTLTVPASDHVEVEIHADGHEGFQFVVPARVSISYERCPEAAVDPSSLSVWHIDEASRLLLELMGGHPDADARRVTFRTGHLSGFIIAN